MESDQEERKPDGALSFEEFKSLHRTLHGATRGPTEPRVVNHNHLPPPPVVHPPPDRVQQENRRRRPFEALPQQARALGGRVAGVVRGDVPVMSLIGLIALTLLGAISVFSCGLLIAACLLSVQLRRMVGAMRVRRENWEQEPTYIGHLFTSPPSPTAKVLYIILKSLEVFVISLYPNYSVEVLEVELQRDRIVR
ncbi:hypothetical protein ADEAN_000938500 [Angomonas deanei]|uniref:Uncharacterized protein n=1 Tax=Angomonas deanei TaxID=59799 RepID=A0A7G2CPZ9_9TRYP|nr:hypothetical protein ADEAN_000938500 [Angomonas deanei]